MRVFKNKMMWQALALSFILAFPVLLSNNAFPHGDAPSTCENRYDATIASMAINNGTQTFDPVNSELEFDAQIGTGYEVAFMLHTANASSQNNTSAGTTWYRNTAFGFGNGVCVDDADPDQDVQLTVHVEVMPGVPDGYTQNGVEWGSWPDVSQVRYKVVWHNATDSESPEEQPSQQDNQTGSEQPPPPTTNEEPENNEGDNESENEVDEKFEDDDSTGSLISPFIFKNETTSVSAVETIEEHPPRIVDALHINGTLASYQILNGMQLYILSGNWSMTMNDTAVFDFSANFTMVGADGLDRQTYSLDNLTAVNDSDLLLANGTMAMTSALDYHANDTITKVNATIILERLNVVKIELDSMIMPVYGVVDKVVRTENGEMLVMARQFDMI